MTRVVGLVLRIFSFLFHFLLIACLLAVSTLARFNHHNLTLEILPWQGAVLTYVLFGAGLAGLLSLALALIGAWRAPFAVWNVIVLEVLARGYFFTSYGFGPGGGSLSIALSLILAALLAAIGSWLHWRYPKQAARRG